MIFLFFLLVFLSLTSLLVAWGTRFFVFFLFHLFVYMLLAYVSIIRLTADVCCCWSVSLLFLFCSVNDRRPDRAQGGCRGGEEPARVANAGGGCGVGKRTYVTKVGLLSNKIL